MYEAAPYFMGGKCIDNGTKRPAAEGVFCVTPPHRTIEQVVGAL